MNIRQFFGHAADLAAIRALMMRYKVAMDKADIETALLCHADHDEISAISLDSIYWGRAEVRRFFERLFSPEVREEPFTPPKESHIVITGDTAILMSELDLRLVKPAREILPCRVTFTLVRAQSEWRILSSHLSAPRKSFVPVGNAAH